ncbi:MAG: hypothetical protein E7616_07710 [Ruminococcaceae bacterium]|nr:hypothetical protein [Oscillospiraceae bacterium]
MYRNNNTLPFLLTCGILGVLLGVLLLIIDFSKILSLLFIIIGVFILIANLPAFIYSLTSGQIGGIISSLFPILAGIVMIFWHNSLLFYILGIYLIILPLLRILLARNKSAHFRIELPRIIIGILLLIIGPGTAVNALFDVAGYVVIALSILFTVIGIYKTRRF